jgi:hypothetical protein
MTKARKDQDDATTGEHEDHIHPEPLDPEKPAAGVDDVIETFDREPPEHPVTDADAPPPFG